MKLIDYIQILLIIPATFYLICWWITLEPNPLSWKLFCTEWGRAISFVLFTGYSLMIFRYRNIISGIKQWNVPPIDRNFD